MKNPFSFYDRHQNSINKNSLGYQQLVTTLTAVGQKVSEQRFYSIAPADYVPVVLNGNGAYQRQIINWRTYLKGEGFETGIINNASNQAAISSVDAAYDQVAQDIYSWAKAMRYNIFELEEAMRANTLFSLLEARETARRKEWDLGIQKIAFLGHDKSKGLLNQSEATVNTSTISKSISSMTAAEFNQFAGSIYEVYRDNCSRTARPSTLVIPEREWNGLINFPDATYPLKTKLELLEVAFKTVSQNQGFKILPCAYADKFDGVHDRYTLLNYDETSIKMDIPLDYQFAGAAGTVNGFQWENVAFGQFTGVIAQRPKELIYFQY